MQVHERNAGVGINVRFPIVGNEGVGGNSVNDFDTYLPQVDESIPYVVGKLFTFDENAGKRGIG
jgi:hypothetical protein